jgi:hypothetical protein
MALAAVAEDGDCFAIENLDVGISVVVDRGRHGKLLRFETEREKPKKETVNGQQGRMDGSSMDGS